MGYSGFTITILTQNHAGEKPPQQKISEKVPERTTEIQKESSRKSPKSDSKDNRNSKESSRKPKINESVKKCLFILCTRCTVTMLVNQRRNISKV